MISFITSHFPKNRSKFLLYLKYLIPLIGGSILFYLNSFSDNFMIARFEQGVTILSVSAQWTLVIIGWFIATSAAGSVVISQFYHDKNYEYVKQISRYRALLCLLFVIPFAIVAWTYPSILIDTFYESGKDSNVDKIMYDKGSIFLRLVAIQWILLAISYNTFNQFGELGFTKLRFYFSVFALVTNVFINSMLIFVFKTNITGVAFGSICARFIFIILSYIFIKKHKMPLSINFFKAFWTIKKLQKIYWKRWVYTISLFVVNFLVRFRGFFFARGYAVGSLGDGISGTSVFGLTTSLMNIFMVTIEATATMTAIFVSSELGKGNLKKAKENADELKGFNIAITLIFAILLSFFALFLTEMSFLSANKYDDKGNLTFSAIDQLKQVQKSLFVVAGFLPFWVWFFTTYRNVNAGGQGNKFSIYDGVISGPVNLMWLAIITLVIIPNWPAIQNNFAAGFALFFSFDLIKLLGFEILYYTGSHSWLYSISKRETKNHH